MIYRNKVHEPKKVFVNMNIQTGMRISKNAIKTIEFRLSF